MLCPFCFGLLIQGMSLSLFKSLTPLESTHKLAGSNVF
jgi:hypothetical protein